MLFALIARDRPGAHDIRKANRDAHLAYVKETGVVVLAGPLLDDDGAMIGSLLILDLPDKDAARAWADNDPYAKAGLFESVTINAWKKVIG
ncbi:hypothetical protein SAMN04490248_12151 [Salinihabitans flavidus]|uniref:YCII-related domain-containing protein n=1 Tax=Salinihabitans flavidus TaxID=569882 RepID=A0A1H8UQI7_9RHOB|nr:YciI family protein [Salinihabitans flavidus]SEP05273.1 hypothetical protein SAMN04490248_12151 [Salinihabitans flavidus]